MATIFSERLRTARKIQNLTLDELAEKLNYKVTKHTLSKYETDDRNPSDDVIIELARVLNVSIEYFFRKFKPLQLSKREYRKHVNLTEEEEDIVIFKANDQLEREFELYELLNVTSEFKNPVADMVVNNEDDIEEVVKVVRKEWDLGSAPIPDVVKLLEDRGIMIVEIKGSDNLDGYSCTAGNIPVIVINQKEIVERKRFTVFHELSHLIVNFSQQLTPKKIEDCCNRFANALLIPWGIFQKEFGGLRSNISINELVRIKEHFGISIQAIMVRAYRLKLISKALYYAFWDLAEANQWKTNLNNEPGRYYSKETPSKFWQLLHKAVLEGKITKDRAAELQNITIEEYEDQSDGIIINP